MHSLRWRLYRSSSDLQRDYRKLWIKRINAGCRMWKSVINNFWFKTCKMLISIVKCYELAINDFETFKGLTETAKSTRKII